MAPILTVMESEIDEYTAFSENNMMKITEFEPLSDVEVAELETLLAVAV